MQSGYSLVKYIYIYNIATASLHQKLDIISIVRNAGKFVSSRYGSDVFIQLLLIFGVFLICNLLYIILIRVVYALPVFVRAALCKNATREEHKALPLYCM